MDLLKRPSPYFIRVFCPWDGFSKTARCAEGDFPLQGQGFPG